MLFLDFDGVSIPREVSTSMKAIGTNRHFLMIQNSLHQYHFLGRNEMAVNTKLRIYRLNHLLRGVKKKGRSCI